MKSSDGFRYGRLCRKVSHLRCPGISVDDPLPLAAVPFFGFLQDDNE